MDVLAARGVTEQSIALVYSDASRAQLLEEPLVNAEGPSFARVWRAVFGMQIAGIVPKIFGKRRLGELDRDSQDAGFVHQVEPVITILSAIAADAVMHEQNRCPGIILARPCGVQHQRRSGNTGST